MSNIDILLEMTNNSIEQMDKNQLVNYVKSLRQDIKPYGDFKNIYTNNILLELLSKFNRYSRGCNQRPVLEILKEGKVTVNRHHPKKIGRQQLLK